MQKKSDTDVLKIFSNLKKTIENRPPAAEMYEEVRMMKFKIRPLAGDISLVNIKDQYFIETLWSLGKLDEVFQKEFKKLDANQKEVFFRIFDEMYQNFQSQLNRLSLRAGKAAARPQIFEMEIFKDIPAGKKMN